MVGGDIGAFDWRQAVEVELQQMEDDLHYTERTHFEMAATYRQHHQVGGVAAAALSATAGAGIIADWSAAATGSAALAAALLTSVLTFMKPERLAEQHLGAGRQLAELRTRVRHTLNVDLPATSFQQARNALEELRSAKATVDQATPGTDDRHFKRARAKIKAGLYERDRRS